MVLLKVVIHLSAVVTVLVGLEHQRPGTADQPEGGQLLVDGVDDGGVDGRSVERHGLFGRDLESAGLDFECLFENDVRHGWIDLFSSFLLWIFFNFLSCCCCCCYDRTVVQIRFEFRMNKSYSYVPDL